MIGCLNIVLAMKPVEMGFVENCLRHECGVLNVDGCRVGNETRTDEITERGFGSNFMDDNWKPSGKTYVKTVVGRWPANLIHDGSEGVSLAFPVTTSKPHAGAQLSGKGTHDGWKRKAHEKDYPKWAPYDDSGSAARLFKQIDEMVLEEE